MIDSRGRSASRRATAALKRPYRVVTGVPLPFASFFLLSALLGLRAQWQRISRLRLVSFWGPGLWDRCTVSYDVPGKAARSQLNYLASLSHRCEVRVPPLLSPHLSLTRLFSVVLIVIVMYKLALRGHHTVNRCVTHPGLPERPHKHLL